MRILVDMDGVLADFDGSFLQVWRTKYPDHPFVRPEERKKFYLTDEYPKEFRSLIWKIFVSRGFFRNLLPMPGGVEAMHEMEQLGFEVFICSSPLNGNRACMTEKYQWIEEHLGRKWTDRLILVTDKTLVRADVLIDDRPTMEGVDTPTWEHILYDQPYNRAETSRRRLTWATWKSVLLPNGS